MKFKQIIENLDSEQNTTLMNHIDNCIITENQITRIFIKTFEIDDDSSQKQIRTAFNTVRDALEIIKAFFKTTADEQAKVNAVKRMMSANSGMETVNELHCHYFLHSLIKNYSLRTLFDEGPDGVITFENTRIPVEIKSRFPKSAELLDDFLFSIFETIPIDLSVTIIVHVVINQLANITSELVTSEVHRIGMFMDNFFERGLNIGDEMDATYELPNTTYSISIKVTGRAPVALSNNPINLNVFSLYHGQISNNGFVYDKYLSVSVDGEISATLAQDIFKGFFPKNNNLPVEPRILVFWCEPWRSGHYEKYIDLLFETYISSHKQTMLLGMTGRFSEITERSGIAIRYISIGEELKPLINKLLPQELQDELKNNGILQRKYNY